MVYEFTDRVRYSQCDRNGNLTLTGIVNYFQDAAIFHSEDVGMNMARFQDENMVWFLNSWAIEILQKPTMGQRIIIGTTPYKFSSMFGFRSFVIKDEDNNILAKADSQWCLLDTETGMPKHVQDSYRSIYGVDEKVPMDIKSGKIKISGNEIITDVMTVNEAQIDTNDHVNNCQYIVMALDVMKKNKLDIQEILSFKIEYRAQAKINDIINFHIFKNENQIYAKLTDKEDKIYANMEFFV